MSPDGDALGSAFSLCRALQSIKKHAKILCSDPVPEKFSYMNGFIKQEEFNPQCLISVDVADEKLLGEKLKSSPLFSDVDLVVAVPLHWTRRLKRGYNQAEVIASTVARVLGCRCESHLLVRNRRTGTQTRLSVEKKSANVKGAFSLNKSWKSDFDVKHILIVDDVFTTGATISECFLAIRSRFGLKVRISIATISIVGS